MKNALFILMTLILALGCGVGCDLQYKTNSQEEHSGTIKLRQNNDPLEADAPAPEATADAETTAETATETATETPDAIAAPEVSETPDATAAVDATPVLDSTAQTLPTNDEATATPAE